MGREWGRKSGRKKEERREVTGSSRSALSKNMRP